MHWSDCCARLVCGATVSVAGNATDVRLQAIPFVLGVNMSVWECRWRNGDYRLPIADMWNVLPRPSDTKWCEKMENKPYCYCLWWIGVVIHIRHGSEALRNGWKLLPEGRATPMAFRFFSHNFQGP